MCSFIKKLLNFLYLKTYGVLFAKSWWKVAQAGTTKVRIAKLKAYIRGESRGGDAELPTPISFTRFI